VLPVICRVLSTTGDRRHRLILGRGGKWSGSLSGGCFVLNLPIRGCSRFASSRDCVSILPMDLHADRQKVSARRGTMGRTVRNTFNLNYLRQITRAKNSPCGTNKQKIAKNR
jgi:hypothetical protein